MLAVAAAGLLVIGVLLGTAWRAIDPVVEGIAGVEGRRLPTLELVQSVRRNDLGASIALRNALLVRSERLTSEEAARFRQLQDRAAQDLGRLDALALSDEAQRQLAEVRSAREAVLAARAEAIAFAEADPAAIPADALTLRLQQAQDPYVQALRGLQELVGSEVRASVSDSRLGTQEVRRLLLLAGALSLALLLYLALAWRRAVIVALGRKDREIAQLARQRDALVREVHHRIKNHLQGLLSLIDMQRAGGPELAGGLEALRGNVLALMALHGLQASRPGEDVPLATLLAQQARLVEAGYPGARVRLEVDAASTLSIPGPQAVPVTLIVTELIVNAIKHGGGAQAEVIVDTAGGSPCVEVRNAATTSRPPPAPQGGAVDAPDAAVGNGLALVDALAQGLGRVVRGGGADAVSMRLELDALAR